MKILVVSAHPDDMEISCSGTLRRLNNAGADIISVVAIRPSREVSEGRSELVVQQELNASYSISNFQLKVFDTSLHHNGRPNLVADNVTMTEFEKLLEPCDIAILPDPQDHHQDHKSTYQLALPWAVKNAQEIWCVKTVPYCHFHTDNNANLFFNISAEWDFKQSLLECYSSYLTPERISDIRIANQYWALRSQCGVAEAFTILQKNV